MPQPIYDGRFYRVKPCPHGRNPSFCMTQPCNDRPQCVKNHVFVDNAREVRDEIMRCRGPAVG